MTFKLYENTYSFYCLKECCEWHKSNTVCFSQENTTGSSRFLGKRVQCTSHFFCLHYLWLKSWIELLSLTEGLLSEGNFFWCSTLVPCNGDSVINTCKKKRPKASFFYWFCYERQLISGKEILEAFGEQHLGPVF